jgi:hypothetical protein
MRLATRSAVSAPALLVPALLVLAAAPAAATSFVMVADRDLADQAPLIVTGRVIAASPAVGAAGAPATDYAVAVEQAVKGFAGAATLTVRSPGGVRADGLGLVVFGAPRFAEGERVLLFLGPEAGGVRRVLHLMLGAFHERSIGGRPAWVRELGAAVEVPAPGGGAAAAEAGDGRRDRDAFVAWLAERAAGGEREADYLLPAADAEHPPSSAGGGPVALPAGFTLFEHNGLNLRWFAFDPPSPQTVRWRAHQDGQPGLTLQQTLTAFGEAMAAWSSGTPNIIAYAYGSPQTTTATGGLVIFDDINAILFEDPNDEITDPFSCATGGVLAIGGPWFLDTNPQTWNGQQYWEVIGGDVVTNDGIACFLTGSGNPLVKAEELFGHELGHTLAFGHSCGDAFSPPCGPNPVLDDALMRAIIHSDLRGARINSDDRAACNALYESRCALFLEDGFESGDLSGWSSSFP